MRSEKSKPGLVKKGYFIVNLKNIAGLLLALACATVHAAEWKPVGDRIRTRWAKEVTPDNAWREYPRPQMVRKQWQNLNGLWNYAVRRRATPVNNTAPGTWNGKILCELYSFNKPINLIEVIYIWT